MENFDLGKISRDELYQLLSRANVAMVEYTRCFEMAEKVKSLERKKMDANNDFGSALTFYLIVVGILIFVGLFIVKIFVSLGILVGCYGTFWLYKLKKDSVNAQRLLNKFDVELPALEKKEKEEFDKFYAVIEPYKFPRDYWYEEAIATMLKFVENQRADNWRDAVNLYENHLYQVRMEENARKTFEEARKQTENAIQNRNASRWAEAGAWRR